MEISLSLPRDFVFGPGSLGKLGAIASGLADKAIVIPYVDEMSSEDVSRTGALLRQAGIHAEFAPPPLAEPDVAYVDFAAGLVRKSECDLVVSIGGGSAIDTAKLVAMLRHNPGSSRDYQMGERTISQPVLPHIAIPTTAGTGAEATKVSVLTNKEAGVKKSIADTKMVPSVALLDPELTLSLPARVTAFTGIDALSHAVESYVSLNANPLTEALAIEAVELVGRSLARAVANGGDVDARGDMLMASFLAGASLNAGVGAAHILGQPLGASIGVSHGEGIALVLPYVVDVNYEFSTKRYDAIRDALGADGGTPCWKAVLDLCREVGITDTLADHGLTREGIERVLEVVSRSTSHIATNPRPVDPALLTTILERAL